MPSGPESMLSRVGPDQRQVERAWINVGSSEPGLMLGRAGPDQCWVEGLGTMSGRAGPWRCRVERARGDVGTSGLGPISSRIGLSPCSGRCRDESVQTHLETSRPGQCPTKSPRADVKSSGWWLISGLAGVGQHRLEMMRVKRARDDIVPRGPRPMLKRVDQSRYRAESAWANVEQSRVEPMSS